MEQKFWFFVALLLEGNLKWIANGKKPAKNMRLKDRKLCEHLCTEI